MPLTLEVVIPCYNEANTISTVVNRVCDSILKLTPELLHNSCVTIIDDSSTDGSLEIIRQLAEQINGKHSPDALQVRCLQNEGIQGKGMAIRTALYEKPVSTDVILIQDADLEYDPEDYRELLLPLKSADNDVVFGSRYGEIRSGEARLRRRWFKDKTIYGVANWMLTKITNLLYAGSLTDESTCYKIFKRQVLAKIPPLDCVGFEFCPELTGRILRAGYSIHEVPVSYVRRTTKEGKKIRSRDFFIAVATLIRERFSKNNRRSA
jgi:glycosyltransferase involved in cell wall biosynthesis